MIIYLNYNRITSNSKFKERKRWKHMPSKPTFKKIIGCWILVFFMFFNLIGTPFGKPALAGQEPIWTNINYGLEVNDEGRSIITFSDTYVLGTKSGKIYSYDFQNGRWNLNYNTGREISHLQKVHNQIYAFGKGVFLYSDNKGNDWTDLAGVVVIDNFNNAAMHGQYILVGARNGSVIKAHISNMNKKWQVLNEGLLTNEEITAVEVTGSDYIIGTKDGRIYSLNHNEVRWEEILNTNMPNNRDIRTIRKVPNETGQFFVFGKRNVFRYFNGDDWHILDSRLTSNPALNNIDIEGAWVIDRDKIFITAKDKGVYYTEDQGETWISRSAGLPQSSGKISVKELFVHGNSIYVSINKQGLFFSNDQGESWLPVYTNTQQDITSILIDESNTIYIGTKSHGVFRKLENESTWQSIGGIPNHEIVSLLEKGDYIYAVTKSGIQSNIFKASKDDPIFQTLENKPIGGLQALPNNEIQNAFVAVVNNKHHIYAAIKDEGIWYTDNQGETWSNISGDLPKDGNKVKVRTIYYHDNKIYAAMSGQLGIFVSENHGGSWSPVKNLNGLSSSQARDIRSILITNDILYIGTKDGVWQTDLNDNHTGFTKIPGDLPFDKHVVEIVKENNSLFAVVNNGSESDVYEAPEWDLEFKSIGAKNPGFIGSNFNAAALAGDYLVIAANNGAVKAKLTFRQPQDGLSSPLDPPGDPNGDNPLDPVEPTEPANPTEPGDEQNQPPIEAGNYWSELNLGISSNDLDIRTFLILTEQNKYFAGTKNGNVYSYNGDAMNPQWELVLTSATNNDIKSISYNSNTNKMYVFGKNKTFFVSNDGGENWEDYSSRLNGLPGNEPEHSLIVGNRLYLAVKDTGIFYTDDEGLNWVDITGNIPKEINKGREETKVRFIAYAQGAVYAAVNKQGLFILEGYVNGQWIWQPVGLLDTLSPRGLEARSILFEGHGDEQIIYLGTKDGVWATASDYSGQWLNPWFKVTGEIPENHDVVSIIRKDSSLYAFTKQGNIYEAPAEDFYFEIISHVMDYGSREFFAAELHEDKSLVATKTGIIQVELYNREISGEIEDPNYNDPVDDYEIDSMYFPGLEYMIDLGFNLLEDVSDLVLLIIEDNQKQDENSSQKPGANRPNVNTRPTVISRVANDTLDMALENAKAIGKIILAARPDNNTFKLSLSDLAKLEEIKKPMEITFGEISFNLNPWILKPKDINLENISSIQLAARQVNLDQARDLLEKAANNQEYAKIGSLFNLYAVAVLRDENTQPITSFNGRIKVSLPVPQELLEDAKSNRITAARYNNELNIWENYPGYYDETMRSFVFETDKFSYWALVVKADPIITFSDINGHWAQKEIEFLAVLGHINGMSSQHFAPNDLITRAQFAKILVNILDIKDDAAIPFNDVKEGQWYTSYIKRAYAANLIKGLAPNVFAPDATITREQMAVMISNALKHKKMSRQISSHEVLSKFIDKNEVAPWAEEALAQVVHQNILQGISVGNHVKISSKSYATRAQAAVILKRLLDQMNNVR